MSNNVKDHTEFTLPANIVTKVDIARLVREFEAIDNAMTAKTVHEKTGGGADEVPSMSPQLEAFLGENPVELDNTSARSEYIKQLRLLKNGVHVIAMTFAVVTDSDSLRQLAAWLRESVHPQVVIDAHYQPALVAGVYVRSQNQVFDLSVRKALKQKRGELKDALGALRG